MLSKEQIEAEFEKAVKGDTCRVFQEVKQLAMGGAYLDAAGTASAAVESIARSGQRLCSDLYEEVRTLRKGLDEARRERADYRSREEANLAHINDLVADAEEDDAAEAAAQEYLMVCLANTTDQLMEALQEIAVLKVKLERATGASA